MRTINVGLTDDQRAARAGRIGGSDANILMAGDPERILRLYEEKIGVRESENLDGVLPVIMGQWTEELNLYWFEQRTGRLVTHAGESCQHTAHSFMACTLDGMTKTEAGREAVFEAKHVNQFSKMPDIVAKYTPQLHHNMAVVGAAHAVISVFIGTMTYEWAEIERDEWYLAELIDREKEFWAAVESKTQPLGMDPVAAPVAPEEWRTEDLTGNNEWGAAAAGWLENRDAAKSFAAAEKAVKGLVPADVGLAHGHGVQCKRSKNNSLRVTEEK